MKDNIKTDSFQTPLPPCTLRPAERCPAFPTGFPKSLPAQTVLELGTDPNHGAGRGPKKEER